MFHLRGHHLLCLVGYRGMGYSEEYVENMTRIHRQLRARPTTLVRLVKGIDHLCEKYPNSGEYHCLSEEIFNQDAYIAEKLGIQIGQLVPWFEVERRLKKYIQPTDLATICETCSWRSYGVCEEGMERIHKGISLFDV